MSELDSIFSGLDRNRAEGEGKKAVASGTKRKVAKEAAPTELSTKKKAKAKASKDSNAASAKGGSKGGSKAGKVDAGEKEHSKDVPASKDGKKAERKYVVVHDVSAARMPAAQRPKPPADDDDATFADSRGKLQRKRTEEGYRIFTEDELKLNQGGDTPLCPFDCTCCY